MLGLLVATLVIALSLSPSAQAADCKLADYDYNGACGPQFELPAWGDGAGWTDPSKYSTIQLADLTGNGVDELIARNDDGIEIWRFDTTVGQWRPAIGANGQPEVLTDFRSPLPSESGPNWNQPQYYKTIQTADLYGNGAHEIIARFPDGMRVYKYTPPAGTKNIDGGTWSLLPPGGEFPDSDGSADPSSYLSIHAISAFGDRPAELIGQVARGARHFVAVFYWRYSGCCSRYFWQQVGVPYPALGSDNPADYLNLTSAMLPSNGGVVPAVVSRTGGGGAVAAYTRGDLVSDPKWTVLGHNPSPGHFADVLSADCPVGGRPVGGPSDCFGDSPSYYETLRFANIDGQPGDEMLGRVSDGLRAYKLLADGTTWKPLATLTALKGSAQGADPLPPGRWSSVRSADILGNGRDQVLALDGNELQAWSHGPAVPGSDSWLKLSPSTPLTLGGAMWDKDASYYSTIQTGDVTGDGHDAVIARGPFGIRTWFYDLKPNSGWTSWLPQETAGSYPQFTGGQAAAFAALSTQAKSVGAIPADAASVRDVWTGENAPTKSALDAVRQAILGFAGCSGTSGNPPYTTCAPPSGSSGFTAPDWTAVVNQVLSEIGRAQAVGDFFGVLDRVRQKLFIAQGAELDAIAGKLGLSGAAGNETKVNPQETTAGILKIIGAIAGAVPGVGHVVAASLEVAGELAGLLASDSPTLNSEFSVKYADLKEKFATMVTEIDKGLEVQSQEVRSSYGLLSLVAQLTTGQGPWANPDLVGLESADSQGFAQWSYQQLLPTLYARYTVTNCVNAYFPKCTLTGAGPETIGTPPNFTTIANQPQDTVVNPTPCERVGYDPDSVRCNFVALPSEISTKVWDPLSDTCQYQPGNSKTKWTFGCNLGVNKDKSVSLTDGPANGWDFQNYCGSPDTSHGTCTGATGTAAVGKNSRLTLTGSVTLPKSFRVKRATIAPDRLLYEPAGPDGASLEVVVRDSGRPLGAVPMARLRPAGDFADPPGGVRASLELGTPSADRRSYDLTLSGVKVLVPSACQALPASDTLSTPPFKLTSTLKLSDGHRTHIVSLPVVWRCVRDRAAKISELQPVAAKRLPQRPGLAVSLTGPGVLSPGASVSYQVRVHNRRGPGQPLISSLWGVLIEGGAALDSRAAQAGARPQTVGQVTELRHGQSRTLSLRVRVPSSATRRICIGVTATADSARPAAARICPRIASSPRVGLG